MRTLTNPLAADGYVTPDAIREIAEAGLFGSAEILQELDDGQKDMAVRIVLKHVSHKVLSRASMLSEILSESLSDSGLEAITRNYGDDCAVGKIVNDAIYLYLESNINNSVNDCFSHPGLPRKCAVGDF